MTEDEAKEKWCHAAVASHTNPRMGFDGQSLPKTFPCIGSACMAWRWHQNGGHDPDLPRSFPHTPQGELNDRRDIGYCGLAGKP